MVASVLILATIVSVVKISKGLWELSFGSQKETEASVLGESIVSKIRTMDFHDVYSIDSNDSRTLIYLPNSDFAKSVTFVSDDYRIPWNLSRSSSIFYAIEREMKEKGFERFTVQVTYLRRDSAFHARVVDYGHATPVPWQDISKTYNYWSHTGWALDGCDDFDANLCFQDINQDGHYYGGLKPDGTTYVEPKDEVPNSGLKHIVVKVYGKNNRVYTEKRTFLTSIGLDTREELETSGSDLPLTVLVPNTYSKLLSAETDGQKAHLELETERGEFWESFSPLSGSMRMDNRISVVTVNRNKEGLESKRSVELPHKNTPLIGLKLPGGFFLRFATQPSGRLEIYIRRLNDGLGVPGSPGNTTPNYTLRLNEIPSQNNANTGDYMTVYGDPPWDTDNVLHRLSSDLNPEGVYHLWFRKVTDGGKSSPFRHSVVVRDINPPICTKFCTRGGGPSPLIEVEASDVDTGLRQDQKSYGLCFVESKISAIVIGNAPGSTVAWVNKGGNYDLVQTVPAPGENTWHVVYRLLDQDKLPSFLGAGTHPLKFEFADIDGYRSSHSWTATIPNYMSDPDGPEIKVAPVGTVDPDIGPKTILKKTIGSTTVDRTSLWDLRSITFQDDQSGINFKTLKVEHCSTDIGTDCQPILNSTFLPKNLKWGNYFIFYPDKNFVRLSGEVTVKFTGYGGTTRVIRVHMTNWAGQSSLNTSLKVYVN